MASEVPTAELKELSVGPKDANDADTAHAHAHAKADDDDDDDDDNDNDNDVDVDAAASQKKKKRKPKKKKKKAPPPSAQSDPPRVLVSQLFPNRSYPPGEEVEYAGDENRYRVTSEEKRHLDNLKADFLADYREAAEVHRQVRQWAQRTIAPGMTLTDIANGIEDGVRALTGHSGLDEGDALVAGMGFPTGLSINHCAAHYTPNAGNTMVLQRGDVLKVDIGVHVGGSIVDSAFTMAFEPRFDPLLRAVRDATDAGVREAGIDARLGEIGAAIQEAMESYEVEITPTTTHPVRSIRNLCGHTILPYSIHGTKSVPIVKSSDQTKMEEGDVFAIETFGSTGNGYVHNDGEVSHYAKVADPPKVPLRVSSAKSLLGVINKNFGTLPFCRRYLDRIGQEKYLLGLNALVQAGIVEDYPPLVDKKGSYTAQYEHTILLRPTVKEVISRGEDY